MRRNGLAGLAMSLGLAMALAACAAGGADPTAAPTADPTAAPTTAPLGVFTGHDACRGAPDPAGADPEEDWVTCDRVATDPRLTGTLLGEYHGFGDSPDLFTAWSKLTLTNEGGTWSCDELQMGSMEGGTGWRDQVCIGEGAYKGLTAYIHSISNDAANTFGVLGWVEQTP